MKDFRHDILKDPSLKECPFTTPEGYFDDLKKRVVRYSQPVQTPVQQSRKIIMTMTSVAAAFIIMIAAGAFFLSRNSQEDMFTQEDFLVFSSDITDYLLFETYAETDILEDDIIEYLIYSGESREDIESYIDLLTL